jgi:hypothetical protein
VEGGGGWKHSDPHGDPWGRAGLGEMDPVHGQPQGLPHLLPLQWRRLPHPHWLLLLAPPSD